MRVMDVARRRMVEQPFAAWGKMLIMTIMIDETGHTLYHVRCHVSEPTATTFPSLPVMRGPCDDRVGRHQQNLLVICLQRQL